MVQCGWLRQLGLQIFTTISSRSTAKARVLLFQHRKCLLCVPSPRGISSKEQVHLFQCALIGFGIKRPDYGVLAVSCPYAYIRVSRHRLTNRDANDIDCSKDVHHLLAYGTDNVRQN